MKGTDLNRMKTPNISGFSGNSEVHHVFRQTCLCSGNGAPSNESFCRCVKHYDGNHKVKSFSCLDQFLCMAFAQLTYRESLRETEICLRAQSEKLYHMGIRGGISRNTLSNANKVRDWRIYADFAQALIKIARPLYVKEDLQFAHFTGLLALNPTGS
jgi:hypothetical protein